MGAGEEADAPVAGDVGGVGDVGVVVGDVWDVGDVGGGMDVGRGTHIASSSSDDTSAKRIFDAPLPRGISGAPREPR